MVKFNPNRRRFRFLGKVALFSLLFQIIYPAVALAQSSGPVSAETQSSAGGTSEMVDLFTGDFGYSIPLMNVDGFPLTLKYTGNSGMNAEASWVGLGWSLNPGSINREMRGLPDDFDGDEVEKELSFKIEEITGENYGTRLDLRFKLLGTVQLGTSFSAKGGPVRSNIRGNGSNFQTSVGLSAPILSIAKEAFGLSADLRGNIGYSRNSFTGKGVHSNLGLGLGASFGKNGKTGGMAGLDFSFGSANTSRGAKSKTMSLGINGGIGKVAAGDIKGNSFHGLIGGGSSAGFSASSDISMSDPTYIPSFNFSSTGTSTFNSFYGGYFVNHNSDPAVYITLGGLFDDYKTTSDLVETKKQNRAYGYLNMENANGTNTLKDFNRSQEVPIAKNMKQLPTTQLTFDIFRASAPGMNKAFRAFRNDVGSVGNMTNQNTNEGNTNIINAHGGLITSTPTFPFTFAASVSYANGDQNSRARSGEWVAGQLNQSQGKLAYKDVYNQSNKSESFYFQTIGENLSSNEEDIYNSYGGENPIQVDIQGGNSISILENELKVKNNSNIPFPTQNYVAKKQKRNTQISYLNAEQASQIGVEKVITSYNLLENNTNGNYSSKQFSRFEPSNIATIKNKKGHHLSQVGVTLPNGSAYVYSTPVYSLMSKQVAFSITNASDNHCSDQNIASYQQNDATLNNNKGKDNMYTETTVPAYAQSFLLTGIISSDYNDKTGDGLTSDDYGSYTKLNYTKVYGEPGDEFKWKSTTGTRKAMYLENNKTYTDDDKGYYSYGEKELWYSHSVEGKNYIAEFYLTDRKDMYSCIDEQGTLDSSKPGKKLSKIVLYNKEDRKQNGNAAEPIQTVHFEYDYSQCRNYPNNLGLPVDPDETANQEGKLTLKKVWFTYSHSQKGKLNPYQFDYHTTNPEYDLSAVDRWGLYKPNNCNGLNNQDHPYTKQNNPLANDYAAMGKLTTITLPSGGVINVNYEADDYQYVQNKKAMELFPIIGLGAKDNNDDVTFSSNNLFRPAANKEKPNDIVFVKIPQINATSNNDAKEEFKQTYLDQILEKDGNYIYYKCKIPMKKLSGEEIIPGFAKLQDYGILQDGNNNYTIGWIQLRAEHAIDSDELNNNSNNFYVNPIMRNAWQYVKNNVPREIFPDNGIGEVEKVNGKMYKKMNKKDYCNRLITNQSFIRLQSPKEKTGGNSRVSKIIASDSWTKMQVNSSDFEYGQEYNYQNGVAAYEPIIGHEENPFALPVNNDTYRIKYNKYPDDIFYQLGPVGHDVYESPIVGYSKVTIKNLDRSNQGVTLNATGNTIHEFHTTKDYPTIVNKTNIDTETIGYGRTRWEEIIDQFSGQTIYELLGMSQGFVIRKNDMNGKPKSILIKGESGETISNTAYTYHIDNGNLPVLNSDGTITSQLINKRMDLVSDFNYTEVSRNSFSKQFGVLVGLNLPAFIIIPQFSMTNTKKIEGYYSNTLTKTIYNYAVLDKVVTTHLGSSVTSKNIVWDGATGTPIVTSTNNEYDNKVYSFSYPAHWYYDGMRNASETYGNHIEGVSITDGVTSLSISSTFRVGDELAYTENGIIKRAWVYENLPFNDIYLIDEKGALINTSGNVDLKVIRSGHKNQQIASMGSITTLDNPIVNNQLINTPTNVLGASALTFSDIWKTRCNKKLGCNEDEPTCGTEITTSNPYLEGILGNWRVKDNYVFKGDRDYSATNTNNAVDIREVGSYNNFVPYYMLNGNNWEENSNSNKWLLTNTITGYDENGTPIESVDALGRYSGVLLGYNNNTRTVPVAMANNAKQNELAYDGFEDYIYDISQYSKDIKCKSAGHFDFVDNLQYPSQLSQETAHTGRYSLKLNQNQKIQTSRYIEMPCNPDLLGFDKTEGYIKKDCNCQLPFSPIAGKEYILSTWVKKEQALSDLVADALITIEFPGSSVTPIQIEAVVTSPLVEGWQRIEGTFTIPNEATCILVSLEHKGAESQAVYFDDLRIHPFNSSMVTSVYDPITLRKWADLDDYNFATYYEYNEQGMMTRVKQETVEGIKTIYETRSAATK